MSKNVVVSKHRTELNYQRLILLIRSSPRQSGPISTESRAGLTFPTNIILKNFQILCEGLMPSIRLNVEMTTILRKNLPSHSNKSIAFIWLH